MKKSTKKSLEGKVGIAAARSLSKRENWEDGTGGTDPEKSRNFGGRKPINDHSLQSNHSIRELTEWEQHSGHDPRTRKGSPIVGSGKRFAK